MIRIFINVIGDFMAKKQQSDTISQQRKARKEFLELKKIQMMLINS